MKRLIISLFMVLSFHALAAETTKPAACSGFLPLFKPICQRLNLIWTTGSTELYLSGYAWHNRWTYTHEKIRSYNETAWGGGMGKGMFDEKGNWQGIYAIAFLDSHKNLEPAVGYAYLKVATLYKDLKAGLGYSVLVTARPDINNNIPFPGAVPWAAIMFKSLSLEGAYIPGFHKNGNVLYLIGKYTF